MPVRRVGADHHDDIGLFDRAEILRACRRAEGLGQAIAGGRMADARAGIDIVVVESGAHHLLHHIDFLVGAARGGDAADGAAAMLGLQGLEAPRRILDRLVPGNLRPRISDLLADHRFRHAILVGGIAPGKAALHAGVALIGAAVLVGNHAHHVIALHLGLEGAAHTAIGAGGDHRVFGLALGDHRLFGERCRRAGLNAGAARNTF